jgi:prepilin-type N-terminal cleavage/methylation domain-containing protein
MPRSDSKGAREGFTVLEMVIALSILGLVLGNILMVTRSSTKAYEAGASMGALDAQLDRTMDRIALALMAAKKDSLTPSNQAPLWTPSVSYEQSLGFEDGGEILSDPERIELVPGPEQIVWKQRPDTSNERKVVWSNWVRQLFKNESLNGLDDDGNGLTDEAGLSFTIDDNRITIRLSLERQGQDHAILTRTQETVVTCRN